MFNIRASTLVCDHTRSESNQNEYSFCKKHYHEDETWLHCLSCKVWFHEECLENNFSANFKDM